MTTEKFIKKWLGKPGYNEELKDQMRDDLYEVAEKNKCNCGKPLDGKYDPAWCALCWEEMFRGEF